jgi:hypothetical protein
MRCNSWPHFTNEEIKVQRGSNTIAELQLFDTRPATQVFVEFLVTKAEHSSLLERL